ncbi:SLBB domain-containing protein [Pacificimonas sp. ICDLI1SI03]
MPANAAKAQLSPQLVEQLQNRSRAGVPGGDPADQIDRSREASRDRSSGRDSDIDDPFSTSTRPLTEEELQVRRLRSRQQLLALERASKIEEEYRERLDDKTLRQFGYDLFTNTSGDAPALTGSVDDSYILGVGDELLVTFSGANSGSSTARVARDGRLIVDSLPPIQAAGRSLGVVRQQIASVTRGNLLGTDVYVSLGGVRSITVFVGGEVERPGQYQVTSMADIAAVLARAGGIRKSGSLRNVQVYRRGASRQVDLYGLLGIGAPPSVSVQDGDRIVVPVIGPTVAITGGVARRGIYEIRGQTSLGELLSYAGGAVPPRGYRAVISRIEEDGQLSLVPSESNSTPLFAGDGVTIVGGSAGGTLNRVTLSGYVANPGPRSLGQARTVAELIGPYQDLQLGTYLPMAVLQRRSPSTGLAEFEAIDLVGALNGTSPVALRADDELTILSREDIAFINSSAVREVLAGKSAWEALEGKSINGCGSLFALEAIAADTQSPRFNTILRNSFFKGDNDVAAVGTALSNDELLDRSSRGNQRTTRPAQVDENGLLDDQDEESICPELFEEDADLLTFVLEQTVSISGAVRRPGAYPIARSEDAAMIVGAADGILASVDAATLEVLRDRDFERFDLPSGRALAGLQNIILSPGDEIRITAPLRNAEDGTVLLSGEFRSPGLYAIRPGERLSQVIARAGGYSEHAYPYGAVLTRENVKESQRAAQQRAARELRETVLTLAARNEVDAEAVGATSQIIETLGSADVPGRMVVEADLTALAARPDLDPLLEGGDAIYVPNRPTSVYVFGSVLNPGALQFQADKSISEYLEDAGGTQPQSDDGRIFVVFPNGAAQPIRRSFWRRSDVVVPPGSTIFVPRDLTPLLGLEIAQTVTGIFGGVAQAIATTLILADRN